MDNDKEQCSFEYCHQGSSSKECLEWVELCPGTRQYICKICCIHITNNAENASDPDFPRDEDEKYKWEEEYDSVVERCNATWKEIYVECKSCKIFSWHRNKK